MEGQLQYGEMKPLLYVRQIRLNKKEKHLPAPSTWGGFMVVSEAPFCIALTIAAPR